MEEERALNLDEDEEDIDWGYLFDIADKDVASHKAAAAAAAAVGAASTSSSALSHPNPHSHSHPHSHLQYQHQHQQQQSCLTSSFPSLINFPQQQQQQQHGPPPSLFDDHDFPAIDISFSPPRELTQSFSLNQPIDPPQPPTAIASSSRSYPSQKKRREGGGGTHSNARRCSDTNVGGRLFENKEKKEFQNLTKELAKLSEQLRHQEHECLNLMKDRDVKDEELKTALSSIAEKDAEIIRLKRICMSTSNISTDGLSELPMDHGHGDISMDNIDNGDAKSTEATTNTKLSRERPSKRHLYKSSHVPEQQTKPFEDPVPEEKSVQLNRARITPNTTCRISVDGDVTAGTSYKLLEQKQENVCQESNAERKCTKAVGIQTDDGCDSATRNADASGQLSLQEKLQAIWKPTHGKSSGRDLVAKLFGACASDLCLLFKYMGCSPNVTTNSMAEEVKSDLRARHNTETAKLVEAEKVGQLYFILTKITNGMVEVDALLGALLDMSHLENDDIVNMSLRLLHVVLREALILEAGSIRDKDKISKRFLVLDTNDLVSEELNGQHHTGFPSGSIRNVPSSINPPSYQCFEVGNLKDSKIPSNLMPLINRLHIFDQMHQITTSNTNSSMQVEALSVMNLIVMNSRNTEREQFGTIKLLESISLLLKNNFSLMVRLQVLRLLFLLLNCDNVMKLFTEGTQGTNCGAIATDGNREAFGLSEQGIKILDGVAECLSCTGESLQIQAFVLLRHAIHVLGYIVAYTKAAVEVLKRVDLLEVLLRILMSQLDVEESECNKPASASSPSLEKERISLVREALVLLCRIVSHPVYSIAALGALSNSRNMLRSTLDVTNRIIAKAGRSTIFWESKQPSIAQADIVNLARVLRLRVSPYLERIS